MRIYETIATGLAVSVSGLVAYEFAERRAQPHQPDFAPVASVSHPMAAVIEPTANALFESVAVSVGAAGENERVPKNDDEWRWLRTQPLMLAEAANLLKIPGRRVADDPDTAAVRRAPQLTVRQLQKLVDRDRDRWNEFATALGDAAVWALEAVDVRNAARLQANGGDISLACERCHLAYRHPVAARHL